VVGDGGTAIVTPSWHALVAPPHAAGADAGRVRLFAKPDDFFELADVADRCDGMADEVASLVEESTGRPAGWAWQASLAGSAQKPREPDSPA
jgi:hypothetical protein